MTVRCLLCCLRGLDHLSEDILRLAIKYKDSGVVGIDIAGDEEVGEGDGLRKKSPDLYLT